LGITKLIFNYLEITTDQVVGLFQQDGLNPQILALTEPLVKQAISWTDMNDKSKYALFVRQGSLGTNDRVAETMLLFVSFVNVFLVRVRQIKLIVAEIGALLKNFRTLKNTTDLGPSQIGHNQIKALVTQIKRLEETLLEKADTLYELQMCEKFK